MRWSSELFLCTLFTNRSPCVFAMSLFIVERLVVQGTRALRSQAENKTVVRVTSEWSHLANRWLIFTPGHAMVDYTHPRWQGVQGAQTRIVDGDVIEF